MQIGRDRRGFHSYTFLEDAFACDMPKVEKIVPDWKPRVPGETVWFCDPKHFGGKGRMIAAMVDPDRAFTMVSLKDWQAGKPEVALTKESGASRSNHCPTDRLG